MIRVGSDCSGVGSFPQALRRLGLDFKEEFSCDFDYFARLTYVLNFGNEADLVLAQSKEHKKYCDGVKKIALSNKETEEDVQFLNEANEFAKRFSFYYPFNMYQREIPEEPLDVYVGSFPCQSFSLAGKRKGEEDRRGVLFYTGHDFIKKNKPKSFIIENVKGLLSDDGGKTFQRWIDFLGGKTVNGNPVIFPHEESVPYHVYFQVLNAKHYGIPQNRERIFIIGIRDDEDNDFGFPKPFPLDKRLKDVLESEVDEKYFLSEKMLSGFINKPTAGFENRFKPLNFETISANTISTKGGGAISDNFIDVSKLGYINQDTQASQVFSGNGIGQTLCAGTHGYANGYVEVKDNVVVEFNLPGKHEQNSRVYGTEGISPTLTTMQGGGQEPKISTQKRIRKLTPTECFRLMDFNPEMIEKTVGSGLISDSQMYKQAGNSICCGVLVALIEKLNLG